MRPRFPVLIRCCQPVTVDTVTGTRAATQTMQRSHRRRREAARERVPSCAERSLPPKPDTPDLFVQLHWSNAQPTAHPVTRSLRSQSSNHLQFLCCARDRSAAELPSYPAFRFQPGQPSQLQSLCQAPNPCACNLLLLHFVLLYSSNLHDTYHSGGRESPAAHQHSCCHDNSMIIIRP